MGKHKKDRKKRAPNKIYETDAGRAIYAGFVRPFTEQLRMTYQQTVFKEGFEAFFNIKERAVLWCKAKEGFHLPGAMWVSPSLPTQLIKGTGRRYVSKNDGVVVRMDVNYPDDNILEFDNQVFVLNSAELAFVNEKLKIIA